MKKLLKLQEKLTPGIGWLLLIYFTVILLFSLYNFNWYGLLVFAAYIGVSWGFYLIPDDDKLKHFYWGLIYTIVALLFWLIFSFNSIWILLPSVFFGAFKETRDYFGNGSPELKDFLFTIYVSVLTVLTIKFG